MMTKALNHNYLFLALIFMFQGYPAHSQTEIITIFSDKVTGIGPCEPSIFINPKSPNVMVASFVNDMTMQTSNTKTVQNKIFLSKDYGKSWSVRKAKSRFGDFGNPSIVADNEGYFYYFHMSDPKKMGWEGEMVMDRIVCQRSSGGKSWNGGASIGLNKPKKHERPWGAFDEHSGRVFVTWTQFDKFNSTNPQDSAHIMLSISDDRGLSWSDPIRINQLGGDCSGDLQTPVGPIPSAGPEQDLYVTWAYDEKIYFDRSIDGGVSWMRNDVVVADQPGGWHFNVPGFGKASGSPVVGSDISYGPHHGSIYVTWADLRNGEQNSDIWISKSTDRGDTWTMPKRVNDDEVVMMGRHQCYNWMTVDPITGYIYVAFYDRRNHEDNLTDVFLAVSTDGGETFSNEKISNEPFEPNDDVFMGDYINITAYGGFVRPIWTSYKEGRLSIQTAIIDPK